MAGFLLKLQRGHVSLSLSSPDEMVVPKEDPVVQEVSDVLREWSIIWRRLYVVSDEEGGGGGGVGG